MVFYLQLLQIERRHRNFLVVLRFFVKIVRITHQFTKDILCIYTINCTFEYIDICVYIFTSRKINYKVPTSCIGKGPLLPNLGITPSTQCISLRPNKGNWYKEVSLISWKFRLVYSFDDGLQWDNTYERTLATAVLSILWQTMHIHCPQYTMEINVLMWLQSYDLKQSSYILTWHFTLGWFWEIAMIEGSLNRNFRQYGQLKSRCIAPQ